MPTITKIKPDLYAVHKQGLKQHVYMSRAELERLLEEAKQALGQE